MISEKKTSDTNLLGYIHTVSFGFTTAFTQNVLFTQFTTGVKFVFYSKNPKHMLDVSGCSAQFHSHIKGSLNMQSGSVENVQRVHGYRMQFSLS